MERDAESNGCHWFIPEGNLVIEVGTRFTLTQSMIVHQRWRPIRTQPSEGVPFCRFSAFTNPFGKYYIV
jgi:hypothetical protein